ncbi:hypothetical protein OG953_43365 (plasmid) [Streptomyces sp. NBC_00057]
MLYEMVTGRRPFTGTSWHLVNQHLNEQPAALRTLRPESPVELERLVGRLLAKDPAQRPDSAEEICLPPSLFEVDYLTVEHAKIYDGRSRH